MGHSLRLPHNSPRRNSVISLQLGRSLGRHATARRRHCQYGTNHGIGPVSVTVGSVVTPRNQLRQSPLHRQSVRPSFVHRHHQVRSLQPASSRPVVTGSFVIPGSSRRASIMGSPGRTITNVGEGWQPMGSSWWSEHEDRMVNCRLCGAARGGAARARQPANNATENGSPPWPAQCTPP